MATGAADGEPKVPRVSPHPRMRLSPVGFWSYSRHDDEFSRGRLSQLRSLLLAELRTQYGRDDVQLFQDVSAIPHGADWERITTGAIDQATFFIPIVTPFYLQSRWCARETKMFETREHAIFEAHPDLSRDRRRIFPLLWIDVSDVEALDEEAAGFLKIPQWCDFSHLRHRKLDQDEEVLAGIAAFAKNIVDVLQLKVAAPLTAEQEERLATEDAARRADAARLVAREEERDRARQEEERLAAAQRERDETARLEEARRRDSERQRRAAESAAERLAARRATMARLALLLGSRTLWWIAGIALVIGVGVALSGRPGAPASTALNSQAGPASANDGAADYAEGEKYYYGRGVPYDDRRALEQYRRAAELGHVDAQARLGIMYRRGEGVLSDYAEGMRWLRRAAASNQPDAQFALGEVYLYGFGTPRNEVEAERWFRRAMAGFLERQDQPYAQHIIGTMYRRGFGVPEDDARALTWLRRAADRNHPGAQLRLGEMYASGEGIPRDRALAVVWYRRAADQGYGPAQIAVGVAYALGWGVPRDLAQQAAWYRRGAERNYPLAMWEFATLHSNGTGVARDPARALAWHMRAADQGYTPALLSIARMYRRGEGVARDQTRAAETYRRATESDDVFGDMARTSLGDMYASGEGVPRDYARAAALYREAAGHGYTSAGYKLGLLLHDGGPGLPQNRQEARALITRAAANYSSDARNWLRLQGLPLPN